jgi:hypothetical protein
MEGWLKKISRLFATALLSNPDILKIINGPHSQRSGPKNSSPLKRENKGKKINCLAPL